MPGKRITVIPALPGKLIHDRKIEQAGGKARKPEKADRSNAGSHCPHLKHTPWGGIPPLLRQLSATVNRFSAYVFSLAEAGLAQHLSWIGHIPPLRGTSG